MNQLKKVREMSFLELHDISDELSIPVVYLQAIEDEKFDVLRLEKEIVEAYIVQYADFLETDSRPIIQAFHRSQISQDRTYTPRRRGKRQAQSPIEWKSVLYTYRFYFVACVLCLVIAFGTWFFASEEKGDVSKLTDQSNQIASSNIPTNKERPIFTLQKTNAPTTSESWHITQADTIHLQIKSLNGVRIRIREDNSKGKIIADKELIKSESFDLDGKKWLFVHLDNPSNALLKVNDVVIDTVTKKDENTYEFKIASN